MKLSVRCLHSPIVGDETTRLFIPVLLDAFFGVSLIIHILFSAFDLPLRRRLLFLLVDLRAIWYGQRSTDLGIESSQRPYAIILISVI